MALQSHNSTKTLLHLLMEYIQGTSRFQTYFSSLEEQIALDNAVRLIDGFINKLELNKLGFTKTVHKSEGRPPYAPEVLLKLYLYGYLNKIRSSRKLERECIRNIELHWLLQNLCHNYHTIADFSKPYRRRTISISAIQYANPCSLQRATGCKTH